MRSPIRIIQIVESYQTSNRFEVFLFQNLNPSVTLAYRDKWIWIRTEEWRNSMTVPLKALRESNSFEYLLSIVSQIIEINLLWFKKYEIYYLLTTNFPLYNRCSRNHRTSNELSLNFFPTALRVFFRVFHKLFFTRV